MVGLDLETDSVAIVVSVAYRGYGNHVSRGMLAYFSLNKHGYTGKYGRADTPQSCIDGENYNAYSTPQAQ